MARRHEDGAAEAARSERRRANDLDGRTWQRYSISVWSDIRKTPEEARLRHPAAFPVALAARLIRCFTTRDDRIILDPFAGTGATLLAAEMLGRVGIGIDVSPQYCELARRRQLPPLALEGVEAGAGGLGQRRVYCDDARNLLRYVAPGSVDLCITSPPYWDILLRRRTADGKPVRHYGDADADLGKIASYPAFLQALEEVFARVFEALRPGRYCVVVVMDLRKGGRFYPFHVDVASRLESIGFEWDDLIVWDRRHEYNHLRPLGYPYRFRVNKVHEFVLIFRKPPAPAPGGEPRPARSY